jgi:lysophospholipase L1-like esterase
MAKPPPDIAPAGGQGPRGGASKESMRISKKIVYSLVLIFVGVFLGLVLSEAALRIRYHFRKKPDEAYLWRNASNRLQSYEHRPGAKVRDKQGNVVITIDSLGFRGRGHHEGVERKPGVKRILILGDSITFGYAQPDDLVYPAVLENLLNEGGEGPRYEVMNSAVSGYNTWNELGTLEKWGPRLRPDLVILQSCMNDFAPSEYITALGGLSVYDKRGDYLPEPALYDPIGEFLEKHCMLFAEVLFHCDVYLRKKGIRKEYYYYYNDFYRQIFLGDIRTPKLKRAFDGVLEATRKIALESRGLGAGFINIVFHSSHLTKYPEPPSGFSSRFTALGREIGYPCLVMRDELWPRRGNKRLFIDECHLNALGHRLVAETLRDTILGHPSLVASGPTPAESKSP